LSGSALAQAKTDPAPAGKTEAAPAEKKTGGYADLLASVQAPMPKFKCPPSGYYPPMYGVFIRNGGDGPAPAKIVSPCTPQELIDAADAIGMARMDYFTPMNLTSIVTEMFTAEGVFALDGKEPKKIDSLQIQVHYGLPALRLTVKASGVQTIRVFNDELAWREASEGGAAKPAMGDRRELQALTRLDPFGAMWSLAESEGHAKVSVVDGKTQIQGVNPYDGLDVTVVLDAKKRPESARVVDGSTVYGATFSDWRGEGFFEPENLGIFPRRLTWTKNGKPYADLTVVDYKTGPYVMFPVPRNVKAAAR
jgi:hypothetical protein